MPYGRPIFQSTPSARRATATAQACGPVGKISIHALREESDTLPVSPEPPPFPFQSTPSARRATISRLPPGKRPKISIHALREESDVMDSSLIISPLFISIHALREEGDSAAVVVGASSQNFNPRPPRGGRLQFPESRCPPIRISIHALREEGD